MWLAGWVGGSLGGWVAGWVGVAVTLRKSFPFGGRNAGNTRWRF